MGVYQRPICPDELYHHGVKGMRWGVRRYQNYDGSLKNTKKKYNISKNKNIRKKAGLTKKQKESLKNVAIGVGAVAATAITVGMLRKGVIASERLLSVGRREAERLSKIPLNALKKDNVKYEKGKTFVRKTKVPVENFSDTKKTYVTTNKEDADVYANLFGAMNKKDVLKPSYQIKYSGKKETEAAGERQRVEIFMQEMTKPEFREAVKDQINVGRVKNKVKPLKDIDKTHTRKYYSEFMKQFGNNHDEKARKANNMLVEAHKRHGFNAIVDDHDKERFSKDPLIILDPDKNLKTEDFKKLNPARHIVGGYLDKRVKHSPENDKFYKEQLSRKFKKKHKEDRK